MTFVAFFLPVFHSHLDSSSAILLMSSPEKCSVRGLGLQWWTPGPLPPWPWVPIQCDWLAKPEPLLEPEPQKSHFRGWDFSFPLLAVQEGALDRVVWLLRASTPCLPPVPCEGRYACGELRQERLLSFVWSWRKQVPGTGGEFMGW